MHLRVYCTHYSLHKLITNMFVKQILYTLTDYIKSLYHYGMFANLSPKEETQSDVHVYGNSVFNHSQQFCNEAQYDTVK